ncbi:hypothetical protein SNE40_003596 [Patella caerulea]|uniref:Uncharacterized protein n=1 Tax=Patella caerulea TaxID=87958 RepID=A0AAN8Q5H1_PATCE
MDQLRNFFTKKNRRVISPERISVSYTKQNNEIEQTCEEDAANHYLKQQKSPIEKMKSWFSKESLQELSENSGVAYRRHPDDVRSAFVRPKSTTTSVACYGRYSSLEILDIGTSQESICFDEDLSVSLISLERIESIQKKSLDVTRHRRKHMKKKENKKRRHAELDDEGLKGYQSMIELPLTNRPKVDVIVTQLSPDVKVRAVVMRKTSIQRKSWEIRRQRKAAMNKRRSDYYQDICPILETQIN